MDHAVAVVPWKPGMTEKQFFDANVFCGQLPVQCKGLENVTFGSGHGCGARNWRVWKAPWMSGTKEDKEPRQRELKCVKCGKSTYVVAPAE